MRNGLGHLSSLPDITWHATQEQDGNHLGQSLLSSAPLTSSQFLGDVYPVVPLASYHRQLRPPPEHTPQGWFWKTQPQLHETAGHLRHTSHPTAAILTKLGHCIHRDQDLHSFKLRDIAGE